MSHSLGMFKVFRQLQQQQFLFISRTMSVFYVRTTDSDTHVAISFEYGHNRDEGNPGQVRTYNSLRLKIEPVADSLTRIATNINKHVNKKLFKKRKLDPTISADEVKITMFEPDGSTRIADETSVADALKHDAVLMIDTQRYKVDLNPPCCLGLSLPQTVMVGFPIFPMIETEFSNLDDCVFTWERVKYKETSEAAGKKGQKPQSEEERCVVGHSIEYSPTNEDINYRLNFTCLPKSGERQGKSVSMETKFEVTTGPGVCPFENRHLYTQKETDKDEIRVVCYNILADVYTDQDYSRDILFNYCPPYALSMDYRKPLIIKELKGYNSDVICLQEVDSKVFKGDLSTALHQLGYEGVYMEKVGEIREGSAIYFKKSKFRLVCEHAESIQNVLEREKNCEDIVKKAYGVPALKEKLQTRTTIIHVVALEPLDMPGRILLVANTHLYFHPDAGHIRAIQVLTSIRYIETLMQLYKKQKPSLVFCGDFNSTPHRAIYEFMTTRSVKADNIDWKNGGDEQFVADMNFSHNFHLDSACGLPAYTNYTAGFNGHLDYIYYDKDALEVAQVIPPPDHKDVEFHTAIPSIVFPSDHIAQICDLKWKQT